jgi:predicted enzyme involved in methoxymalonyl-ACP biosynthesis
MKRNIPTQMAVEGNKDDLEVFLKSLGMEAAIEEVGPSNMERVVTMLGKANQFNLTTHRYSHAHVQTMLASPGSIALALRLRDKFGDQGSSPSCSRFVVTMQRRSSSTVFSSVAGHWGAGWKTPFGPPCCVARCDRTSNG